MNKRNHSARQLPFFSKSNDQTLSVDRIPRTIALLLTIVTSITWSQPVMAQQVVVTTTKGLQHEGERFTIEQYSVGYKALSPYGAGNLVVVIDDGLRRVFIGQNSVANANGESQRNEIEFDIVQKEYNGSEGTNRYVQGITKITPRYCIVNVLTSGSNLKQWRMSVATSMIDPQILRDILIRRADPNNVNDLFDIADFFRQTKNYEMARKELLLIKNRFPEEKDRVEEERIELLQIEGRQILADIDKRLKLGQTRLAATFAKVADNPGFSNDIRAKFDTIKQVANRSSSIVF